MKNNLEEDIKKTKKMKMFKYFFFKMTVFISIRQAVKAFHFCFYVFNICLNSGWAAIEVKLFEESNDITM